jgi:hypothetical protein
LTHRQKQVILLSVFVVYGNPRSKAIYKMLFPPIAAILFFIWLYCAVIAPRIVLNSRLNIPGKLLFPVLALAVAAGPVAVVAVQVLNLVFHFRNQRDAAADDRAKQELQSVQFENVRGSQLFDGSRESDADEGAVNTLKRLIREDFFQTLSTYRLLRTKRLLQAPPYIGGFWYRYL